VSTQIVTIFRSRLNPGVEGEYSAVAGRMADLARRMPGYVEHKSFRADDGERVTIVTFADQRSHDAWREHPEHLSAQRSGRESFYSEYRVEVAGVLRSHGFRRD
jgi:heme-degrading monooxygenase HmoA